MMKQFHNAAASNHHHCRFLHYDLLRKVYAVTVILFAAFIKGDTSTPSKVRACISYNATGFPHLNLQWEDSGIDQITDIKIYYSVNGRNELNITIPYQGTNNITDITLSNVQYNDNISVQIVMQNATTMTRRSDRSLIRANPLYSIYGFYINSDLAIVCELACRTKIIKGCNVSLLQESKAISMQSDELNGTSEKISGQISIVVFNNISSNRPVSYQASALTDASITEFGEQLLGSVSRQVSINSTSGTTTIVSSQTPTDIFTTTLSSTSASMPIITTIVSTSSNYEITEATNDDHSSTSDSSVTIIGTMGGVILLLIVTIVMCIVILRVRCNEKGASRVDNKVFNSTTNCKLKTNVTIENNPSCDVTKANTLNYLYIKPGDPGVPIITSPSYSVPAKHFSKTSKDEHNYEQPDEFNQYSGLEATITMDVNPSYEMSTANGAQRSNEGEYGVINQPKCSDSDYEITYAITDSQQTIMKNANSTKDANPSYGISTANGAKQSNEGEYGVINQPKCDDSDYEITYAITNSQQTIMKNANPTKDANPSFGTGNYAQPSKKDKYRVANQLECGDMDCKITHDITANQ